MEDKLLLICTLPNLGKKHRDKAVEILRKDINWDYFVKKAFQNRIFPQTYEHLDSILDDYPELERQPAMLADMKEAYNPLMVTNLILRHEARKAVKALARSKIIYTPLKGFLLDMLTYPDSITRDFVDIDLLFPNERERTKAEEVLSRLGFKRILHPHSVYHTILKKRISNTDATIELHSSLPGITHLYEYPIIEEFWDTLIEREVEGIPILVMPPETMFLILALHSFREGYIKLKDLADMIAIIDSTAEFDWNKIEQYSHEVAWNDILAIPLYAFISLKQSLNEEYPEKLHAFGNRFLRYPYKGSYPILYSTLCNSLKCDNRCKNCLLLIRKQIPGFPDTLSMSYFIKYFPIRFKLANHFLITYVRKDYGTRYAFKCYINMTKALVQIIRYVFESVFNARAIASKIPVYTP